MTAFDYIASKEMALRLVEKFGTVSKVKTQTRDYTVKTVFVSNKNADRQDSTTQQQNKQVYCVCDGDINTNDKLDLKGTIFLITNVEVYNFDGKTKVLYILDIAR